MKGFQSSPVLWIILQKIRIHRSLQRCRIYAQCKERRSCSALMPREHIPWGGSGVRRENKGPLLSQKQWIMSIPIGKRTGSYLSLKVEKGGWRGGEDPCLKEQWEFGGPSGRQFEIYLNSLRAEGAGWVKLHNQGDLWNGDWIRLPWQHEQEKTQSKSWAEAGGRK